MKQQVPGYPVPAIGATDTPAGSDACTGLAEELLSRIEMDRLYRDGAPTLRRFFRNRVRDADAADDLVQETFLRLTRNGATAHIRNPAAWLQRVARNLLFDRARRNRAQTAPVEIPFDEALLPPTAPEQLLALEAQDMLNRYESALAVLGERTRQVFLLHRIDELTYREIAARLGISVATVEYHMMRALAHFDRMLGDR